MYKYGDLVTIVRNSRNVHNAAYKRFKKGEENIYRVLYFQNRWESYVHVCWVNQGRATNAYYKLLDRDILPKEIVGKTLEDYF